MRSPQERVFFGALLLLAAATPARPWPASVRGEEAGIPVEPAAESNLLIGSDEGQGHQRRELSWLKTIFSGRNQDTVVEEVHPVHKAEADYLNGLVAASVEKTGDQRGNLAFVKTHKTASTTLAYLLYRYARRHHLKLAYFDDHNSAIPLQEAVAQTKGGKGRVDIMHYHMSVFGQYEGSWEQAEQAYRRIMRDGKEVNFITVVREPRSHLLSYYYYFLQPRTKKSIEAFLTKKPKEFGVEVFPRLFNPLSSEFGVKTEEDMKRLISTSLPKFRLVILTEQFDEGLMVLRRLLGWEMVDMSYCSMYKTAKGSTRFDGKPLLDVPHFDDLPENVQNIIDELTKLDQILYKAATKEYEKRRDLVATYLKGDLAEFEQLQGVINEYLDVNASSKANVMYKSANIYADEQKSPLYSF